MTIGTRSVGAGHPPFIIAEMSGNHNGSLDRALQIVDAAAAAGAHALKIQTYTADTMTLDLNEREFRIDDRQSLWYGYSLYQLYAKAHTPWEWHEPIFRRCREKGIIGFSTPFDAAAIRFLESLDVPVYKIASFENTDIPLIRAAAATGRPLIMSTGLATSDEIAESVNAARQAGCRELVLLKCTSAYPADPASANLLTMDDMRRRFQCEVGLSDHTLGLTAAIAGAALGAAVIEKHVTLSRSDGGVDAAFSLEPAELAALVLETEKAWWARGRVSYGPSAEEKASLRFRRSLYIAKDIKAGEALTAENLRVIRPGLGAPPKHYERLLGRTVNRDLSRGTPLELDYVD